MDDVGDFLSTVLPLMRDEVVGIHEGTAATRLAVWSHPEPVTLFGAEMSRRGWDQWRIVHRHGDGYTDSNALPS